MGSTPGTLVHQVYIHQLPGGMILQVALNQHHDDGDMVGYSPDFFGGMNINRYEFDVNRRGFYGF
jgi:hypothetical protein